MWSRTFFFSLTSSFFFFFFVFKHQVTCWLFFLNSLTAREALRSKHPLMKLRPLSKSSNATKAKARSCSGTNTVQLSTSPIRHQFVFCVSHINTLTHPLYLSHYPDYLLPAKERPQTSATLARRLVIGALGVKSNLTKEQREAERRKLQEAKGTARKEVVLHCCTKSWEFVLKVREVFECIL